MFFLLVKVCVILKKGTMKIVSLYFITKLRAYKNSEKMNLNLRLKTHNK